MKNSINEVDSLNSRIEELVETHSIERASLALQLNLALEEISKLKQELSMLSDNRNTASIHKPDFSLPEDNIG